MNKHNANNDYKIDQYLEEDVQPTDIDYPRNQYTSAQTYEPIRKNNTLIITLLSAILVVGIAILMIQIFHPFNNSVNNMPNNNNGNIYQQEPNGNGPNTNINGSENGYSEGPEQSGQFMDVNGNTVNFKIKNGVTEYSYDGGNTWTTTPPEGGGPPLP